MSQDIRESDDQQEGPEVLITWKRISRYCGVSVDALINWRNNHGFPAAPLPDGRIAVTKNLIEQWLMARQEVATAKNTMAARFRGQVGYGGKIRQPAQDENQRVTDES